MRINSKTIAKTLAIGLLFSAQAALAAGTLGQFEVPDSISGGQDGNTFSIFGNIIELAIIAVFGILSFGAFAIWLGMSISAFKKQSEGEKGASFLAVFFGGLFLTVLVIGISAVVIPQASTISEFFS